MRIAIVNDTAERRGSDPARPRQPPGRHSVAWSADAGADAVAMCESDRPDLLLMDLTTRGMDGVEAIRRINTASPCAILVIADAAETHSSKVFDAMGAGALDVVKIPCVDGSNGAGAFVSKIDTVASLIGRSAAAARAGNRPPRNARRKLVAIGSSAGGPAALASLLRDLPADFNAAVIVVQHIDAQFAPGLARWLGEQCKLPVRTAASGDVPLAGAVLLAATNDHLILETSSRLGYTRNPVEYSYRPSVNAFFESCARHWRGPMIGVLLTGMGSDGAKGLKMLRNLGHHTIAQDQPTSAVYGMPKAAVELQAAAEILPLDRIAAAIGLRLHKTNMSPVSATIPADYRAIILLVDDQAFVAEVLRRFFADEKGMEFHYVGEAAEAINTANKLRPTVILQDLVMPGTDGLSLVTRYRANPLTKDTPIIVLSTKEEPQTKSLAFNLGANDYLVKLPDRLELIARVRYHSKAYLNHLQRDEAYRALRESQQQLIESNTALISANQKLGEALSEVKQLTGLLPMCSYCKRVRTDKDYWDQIESYLARHSDLRLSHGVCDQCFGQHAEALGITPRKPPESSATIAPGSRSPRKIRAIERSAVFLPPISTD